MNHQAMTSSVTVEMQNCYSFLSALTPIGSVAFQKQPNRRLSRVYTIAGTTYFGLQVSTGRKSQSSIIGLFRTKDESAHAERLLQQPSQETSHLEIFFDFYKKTNSAYLATEVLDSSDLQITGIISSSETLQKLYYTTGLVDYYDACIFEDAATNLLKNILMNSRILQPTETNPLSTRSALMRFGEYLDAARMQFSTDAVLRTVSELEREIDAASRCFASQETYSQQDQLLPFLRNRRNFFKILRSLLELQKLEPTLMLETVFAHYQSVAIQNVFTMLCETLEDVSSLPETEKLTLLSQLQMLLLQFEKASAFRSAHERFRQHLEDRRGEA